MCFTPAISLTTALIEFAFAFGVFYYFRKSILAKYVVPVLILLGIYQFSEFGFCTTGDSALWGTLAFISFTFLPAVGLHMALAYLKKKRNLWMIYALPVAAALTPLIVQPFIFRAECERYFVTVWTFFADGIPSIFYGAYYFGFIIAIFYLYIKALRKASGKKRYVLLMLLAGILLMGVPAVIVTVIFPATRIQLSSVLCQFAFLTTIALLLAVAKDAK